MTDWLKAQRCNYTAYIYNVTIFSDVTMDWKVGTLESDNNKVQNKVIYIYIYIYGDISVPG